MRELRRYPDPATLFDAAVALVAASAEEAIAERGRFLLVLAGGSTPRGVYERLAERQAERLDWERVHFFWGDERCVAPNHPASNFRMAEDSLLRRVPVPDANVHRIRGEEPIERAASLYDAELATFFGAASPTDVTADAAFDLVLLGIGEDGHTASLFPGSPALRATGWATAAQAPPGAPIADRVTLTLPAIGASRDCVFLVTGSGKRDAVRRALHPSAEPSKEGPVPAALVRPRGRTTWLIDQEAAELG